MRGTILGDIVGSPYEFCSEPIKTKYFVWFADGSRFTDDTVTTIAVAEALAEGKTSKCGYAKLVRQYLKSWCRRYPDAGFGRQFACWFSSDSQAPYGSYGNGAAMRVSPAAWVGESIDEVQALAEITALVTHDHPEAVQGAVAVASAIYMARTGSSKEDIRAYIQQCFYPLQTMLDDIRPGYAFTCRTADSVPEAIEAFLESSSTADAINNAVSLGGDTDTQAAIAGAIAEAFYGVPPSLWQRAQSYLPAEMQAVISRFALSYMT